MVLSLLLLLFVLIEGSLCGGQERRLLNDLLTGYIKEARPTPTFDEPVVVVFGLDLQQIIDMDEQNQAGNKRTVAPIRSTRNPVGKPDNISRPKSVLPIPNHRLRGLGLQPTM